MKDIKKSRTARSAKKPAGGKRSKRTIRLVVKSVLAVVVISVLGFASAKAVRPYLLSYGERKEIAVVKAKIEVAKADQKALKEQLKYASTPEGREAEMRKHGWAKPGEIAVVIPEEGKASDRLPDPGEAELPEPLWQKAGRHVLGLFVRED